MSSVKNISKTTLIGVIFSLFILVLGNIHYTLKDIQTMQYKDTKALSRMDAENKAQDREIQRLDAQYMSLDMQINENMGRIGRIENAVFRVE